MCYNRYNHLRGIQLTFMCWRLWENLNFWVHKSVHFVAAPCVLTAATVKEYWWAAYRPVSRYCSTLELKLSLQSVFRPKATCSKSVATFYSNRFPILVPNTPCKRCNLTTISRVGCMLEAFAVSTTGTSGCLIILTETWDIFPFAPVSRCGKHGSLPFHKCPIGKSPYPNVGLWRCWKLASKKLTLRCVWRIPHKFQSWPELQTSPYGPLAKKIIRSKINANTYMQSNDTVTSSLTGTKTQLPKIWAGGHLRCRGLWRWLQPQSANISSE